MKKIIALILALTMVFALAACGSSAAREPDFSAVCQKVDESVSVAGTLTAVDADYIKGALGIDSSAYTDAMVKVTNTGTAIDEYGVFKCADDKAAEAVKAAVEAYIQQRIDTWMGYTPEELPKLENADLEAEGSYVFYAILGDAERDSASSAFTACFAEG